MDEEKIDYKRIILMTVATTGLLALAVLAPNAVQILKPFIKNKKNSDVKYYLNKKTKKLIKDGFIKIEINNKKQFLSLTEKGEKQLTYYKIKEKKEVRWDGKWRVVIFDVWESSRVKRNLLRNEIKDYGFVQLQRSVWVYPYDCVEFVELLKTDLSFGKNIRYMVVEKLDYDENLRKSFKLD
ncbi:MAG: hypothetical protein WCW47_02370 [Candidatus Paceibacterota bacterium]|jgi:DNA-binding transcriptional regulator PaaX